MILYLDLRVRNFLGSANVIRDFCDNVKKLFISHVVVAINLKAKYVQAIKQIGFTLLNRIDYY